MKDTDKIKQKLDIIEFINDYTPLKKTGRNFSARCPFHSEKSASFIVSPDRQIWHCFGACNEGGDIFTFYMKQEGVSFPEALKDLSEKAGIKLSSSFEHDDVWQERKRLYEINHLASEYYHFLLTKHKAGEIGRTYQKKRGINDKIVETFILGYAPSGWRNLLPFLVKKGYREEEIEKAGLIIKSPKGYYDRFRGRFIFTLKDHRGQVVGLSGRILGESKQAKYINSPETPIYHKGSMLYGLDITKESVKKQDFAVIVEGEFDVLSAFQAGISNVVAIKGTALTNDQLRLLKRYTTEIRLALDMDIAGDSAVRKGIELADEMDLIVRVIAIHGGKDLDEALKDNVLNVKNAVKKASTVYDFILTSAQARHTTGDAIAKKKISEEVIPIYLRIANPIVRNHYVKRLAGTLSVSEESILEEFERFERKRKSPTRPIQKKSPNRKDAGELLEYYLLSLILQSKNPQENLKIVQKSFTIQSLQSSPVKRVLKWVSNASKEEFKKVDLNLPEELVDTYNRAYLADITSILAETKAFEKELHRTIVSLRKRMLRMKMTEIATKMKTSNNLSELNKQFKIISSELNLLEK